MSIINQTDGVLIRTFYDRGMRSGSIDIGEQIISGNIEDIAERIKDFVDVHKHIIKGCSNEFAFHLEVCDYRDTTDSRKHNGFDMVKLWKGDQLMSVIMTFGDIVFKIEQTDWIVITDDMVLLEHVPMEDGDMNQYKYTGLFEW